MNSTTIQPTGKNKKLETDPELLRKDLNITDIHSPQNYKASSSPSIKYHRYSSLEPTNDMMKEKRSPFNGRSFVAKNPNKVSVWDALILKDSENYLIEQELNRKKRSDESSKLRNIYQEQIRLQQQKLKERTS